MLNVDDNIDIGWCWWWYWYEIMLMLMMTLRWYDVDVDDVMYVVYVHWGAVTMLNIFGGGKRLV